MTGKNYSVARIAQYTQDGISKAERHIERKNKTYENMNVDLSRSEMNVRFKSCGDLTYNEQLEKMISEGSVSLRGLKKDAKVFDEVIFDVNTAYFEYQGGYEFARRFYEEVYCFAEKEYGSQNVISAVMHADELNTALTQQMGKPTYHYHLHVVALPVVEKEIRWSKRCKDPTLVGTVKEVIKQVSHSKKWASQQVEDETGHRKMIKSYSLLQDRFYEHMRAAGFQDFERGERGSTAEHLSVLEYKTKMGTERLAEAETREAEMLKEIDALTEEKTAAQNQADYAIDRIQELAPKLKNIEAFARKYSDDADRILPEARLLESGKSYREKAAIPIFKKVITVLRGLYNIFLDLKRDFERMKEDYQRVREEKATLNSSLNRIISENRGLNVIVDKYDTLCRGYGEEVIEEQVRTIQEKERQARELQRRSRNRDEIEC